MKTSVNMIRKMGDFEVIQRTKDGMFNLTSLAKQWNEQSGQKKEITKFFELVNTKHFINALLEEENLNTQDSAYLKTRGKCGGTWGHPYLFVKFAMWLNPKFEVQVIKFVYDKLIEHRHLAGDNYRLFCAAVQSICPNIDFSDPGKWLNYVVFNIHEKGKRNSGKPLQVKDLQQLEKKYTDLIVEGYIIDIDVLKEKLRDEWRNRHGHLPSELIA